MKPIIVVVEDNFIIALDIRGVLEEAGFEVITNVVSVEQAIATIKENNPVLVLIDINLKKEKDGINLGNFLLRKNSVPYIYVSSFSDNFTLERVKESRPYGYVVKPFKKSDITTAVALALNDFKHANRIPANEDMVTKVEIPFILKDIIDYVDEHINDKISINDLTLISRWKHQHFIRVFTSYIGVTPYQYVLIKKIDRAKILICSTDLSISDISCELGFHSYGNFCNAFKKITAKTPNNFRKLYSKSFEDL